MNVQIATSRAQYQLQYAFTIPGFFKLVHLVLNLVGLVLTCAHCWNTYNYFTVENCLWLTFGGGLCISGFLFILYSLNLIDRSRQLTWIADSVYCFVWALIILTFTLIIRDRTLNSILIVCISLVVIYTLDCYIKCYGWVSKDFTLAEKNVFNSHKPQTTPFEVISTKIPSKSDGKCPFISKLSQDYCCKLCNYNMSFAGFTKIIVMIFEFICFIILKVSNNTFRYLHYENRGLYLLSLATVTGFCITGLLVIFYTLRLIDRSRRAIWILECVFCFFWAIFMLGATVPLVVFITEYDRRNGLYISACTFGFLLMVLYAVDCGFKMCGCIQKRTPVGEPSEECESAVPPVQV
uniref:MARVEL domain-containing protein n=1 Tax=Strigamia maritima TaxID=126957 RepID=T1IIA2_STRMM